MSLLLSPHASPRNNNQHLAPSIGDIDTILDPELTRDDSLSFMSDNNEPKPKIEEDLPDLTPEALVKILSNPGSSLPRLVSRRSINKNREYTTEEKIVQIHKGQHVLGALKGGMYFVGEPQLVPDTVIRQAIQINYKKHNDGTLEMINQVQLKKQKQVLGHLMKQFGSALFTGKSIMNISLPVSIFESQSHLEREARSLSYAPHFLEKGGTTTNPLEQFKLAAAQFVSSLHLGSNPQKPFNPVLGETFQGKIGDCPVYVEQISHHPPAAATQLFGKNFTLEAKIEFTAAISMNSVKSAKIGFFKVTYKNTRTVIRVHYPQTLMTGTAIGKRNFQFADKFSIFDIENGHYAEICFDNNETHLFKKKSKAGKDQFSGAIWKVNNIFIEKLKQVARRPQDIENLKFKEKEHAIARLENIEGSWLEYLKIGNQVYWSFGELLPFKLQYSQNPLPSDSNYRLDVLYLRAEDEIKSQKNKEIMEESQRYDRKLRENYKKRFAK